MWLQLLSIVLTLVAIAVFGWSVVWLLAGDFVAPLLLGLIGMSSLRAATELARIAAWREQGAP